MVGQHFLPPVQGSVAVPVGTVQDSTPGSIMQGPTRAEGRTGNRQVLVVGRVNDGLGNLPSAGSLGSPIEMLSVDEC